MRQALTPPPPPHPIVQAIRAIFDQRRQSKGSATEFRDLMQAILSCRTPAGVSRKLRSCTLLLADHGIELKFRRLHEGTHIVEIREEQADAWSQNTPPHASPDSETPPQPAETEEVKS